MVASVPERSASTTWRRGRSARPGASISTIGEMLNVRSVLYSVRSDALCSVRSFLVPSSDARSPVRSVLALNAKLVQLSSPLASGIDLCFRGGMTRGPFAADSAWRWHRHWYLCAGHFGTLGHER